MRFRPAAVLLGVVAALGLLVLGGHRRRRTAARTPTP